MKGNLLSTQLPVIPLTIYPFMMGCRVMCQLPKSTDPFQNALRVIGMEAVDVPFTAGALLPLCQNVERNGRFADIVDEGSASQPSQFARIQSQADSYPHGDFGDGLRVMPGLPGFEIDEVGQRLTDALDLILRGLIYQGRGPPGQQRFLR